MFICNIHAANSTVAELLPAQDWKTEQSQSLARLLGRVHVRAKCHVKTAIGFGSMRFVARLLLEDHVSLRYCWHATRNHRQEPPGTWWFTVSKHSLELLNDHTRASLYTNMNNILKLSHLVPHPHWLENQNRILTLKSRPKNDEHLRPFNLGAPPPPPGWLSRRSRPRLQFFPANHLFTQYVTRAAVLCVKLICRI